MKLNRSGAPARHAVEIGFFKMDSPQRGAAPRCKAVGCGRRCSRRVRLCNAPAGRDAADARHVFHFTVIRLIKKSFNIKTILCY
uniref:Uncharacterized protein n=1 Tax=Pararge aegeria TaxID=116150 RepID=S4PSG9_9NEOP